jgi:hypothetical protein
MNEEYIIVEADYGRESIWVVCDYINLTKQEVDLLSTILWKYKYKTNFDLWVRGSRKNKQWEFDIKDNKLLDLTAKELVETIKKLFPNKQVEFSEENKYE